MSDKSETAERLRRYVASVEARECFAMHTWGRWIASDGTEHRQCLEPEKHRKLPAHPHGEGE